MIDVKALEDPDYLERYKKSLTGRGEEASLADKVLEVNASRKKAQAELDECKAYQNKIGKEIAQAKKNKEDASEKINAMQEVAQKSKALEHDVHRLADEVKAALEVLPNICHPSVPVGASEEDNQVVDTWGEAGEFSFEAKDHIDLGESLGILDFTRASKVTGARFSFLKGPAARLERALIQFMMDLHAREHGYTEMIPPFIVNNQSLYGTGQFPKFREDVFHVESSAEAKDDTSGKDDGVTYHLIPTAEVPVTNFLAGEILSENEVPQSYVAYSPCFRSEAGSYGRDTRGLIRQHQFNKVELVKFVRPEDSEQAHEDLTGHAEKVLQMLELPYRKSVLCTGDMGFGATKCYDLEVWLPGQKKYREISSCSNFGDFQARRANIRFRPGVKEKPQFVHTLNGSGLAVGRTLIAILENFQREDGSVNVPAVLLPYTQGLAEIR